MQKNVNIRQDEIIRARDRKRDGMCPNIKAYAVLKRLVIRRAKGAYVNWGLFQKHLQAHGLFL